MTEVEQCPRCGKALVVHGSFSTRGLRFGFRPEALRLFSLSLQFPEVPVPLAADACASCGLVWSELDAAPLSKSSATWATRTCDNGWQVGKMNRPSSNLAAMST